MTPAEFTIRIARLGFRHKMFTQYVGVRALVTETRHAIAAKQGSTDRYAAERRIQRAMNGITKDKVSNDLVAALNRCEDEFDQLVDEFTQLVEAGKPVPVPNANWPVRETPVLRGIAPQIWIAAAGFIWDNYPEAEFEFFASRHG